MQSATKRLGGIGLGICQSTAIHYYYYYGSAASICQSTAIRYFYYYGWAASICQSTASWLVLVPFWFRASMASTAVCAADYAFCRVIAGLRPRRHLRCLPAVATMPHMSKR